MKKFSGSSFRLLKGDTLKTLLIKYTFFFLGLMLIGLGIAMSVKVMHLGLHPWDVLSVGFYEMFGWSIGTWVVLIGLALIVISLLVDGRHVNIGTFMNALLVGPFIDFFLWLDFLPDASHTLPDYFLLAGGIVVAGMGGGLNVAGGVGAGPRDGFMLTVAERTGLSVRKARITVESVVLVIGFLLGGPVYVATFLYTFIQSPVFQFSLKIFTNLRLALTESNPPGITVQEEKVPAFPPEES